MNITIRPATLDDYEELRQLFDEVDALHAKALPQVFRTSDKPARPMEYIYNIITSKDAVLFVAEYNKNIIGQVHIYIQSSRDISILVPRRYAAISDIVVTGKYRRSGVGKLLVDKAEQWAKEKGINQVELNVWDFNRSAMDFYTKLGYTVASHKMWKTIE